MPLKVKVTMRGNANRYPATFDVDFIGKPRPGEIEQKKKKVQDDLKKSKVAQEKKGIATAVFKLDFKWKRKKGELFRYELLVTVKRDRRFKQGGGGPTEVPPKPKDPSIPPS